MRTILSRGLIAAALALSLSASAVPAFAFDEASTAAINVDNGLALKGHDPVAYFTKGAPTMGKADYTATHAGATYRFESAANRDAFTANPGKYAPQYGGFCAMGAAMGRKFNGDPAVWKVVDGKLYLNLNADVSKAWQSDIPGNLQKAEANWPKIKDTAPRDLK